MDPVAMSHGWPTALRTSSYIRNWLAHKADRPIRSSFINLHEPGQQPISSSSQASPLVSHAAIHTNKYSVGTAKMSSVKYVNAKFRTRTTSLAASVLCFSAMTVAPHAYSTPDSVPTSGARPSAPASDPGPTPFPTDTSVPSLPPKSHTPPSATPLATDGPPSSDGSAGKVPQAEGLVPLLSTEGRAVPNEYIVVLHDGVPGKLRARATNLVREAMVERARELGGRITSQYSAALSGFAAKLSPAQLTAIRRDPRVAYVSPNSSFSIGSTLSASPNDVGNWGLDRIDQLRLPLDKTYHMTTTGQGVTVYVVDSGIRTSHAEFERRAELSTFTAPAPVTQGNTDCLGHGTHVAGTIGGHTYGVARAVKLVALRVTDCSVYANTDDMIRAVEWITRNRAANSLVNMSIGGRPNPALESAVSNSIASGITYVVAAGNDNRDACDQAPARVPTAITVGATNSADARSAFSNYGRCVDLFAPGENITSASHSSDTASRLDSGTSMAAPHVAGIVAQYLTWNPGASPAQVHSAITNAASRGVLSGIGANSPNALAFSKPIWAPGPSQSDRLKTGEALLPGQRICSPNRLMCLLMQSNGTLDVQRTDNNKIVWSNCQLAGFAIVQVDGNFVAYRDTFNALWASGTPGNGRSTLMMQDNGDLVLYRDSDHKLLWASHTVQPAAPTPPSGRTDRLLVHQGLLKGGNQLTSPSGEYTFGLQSNGLLQINRKVYGTIWSPSTAIADWFNNQGDGNLVTYRWDGSPLWASNSAGGSAGTLVMQDNGDLVLYRDSDRKPLWASHTVHPAPPTPPIPAGGRTDRLSVDRGLVRGGVVLTSPSGEYSLALPSNGTLQINRKNKPPVWSVNVNADWLVNQVDGNVVLYRHNGTPLWATGTTSAGPSTLVLQNNGDLVLYRNSGGAPVWASHSAQT
jgi:aqualysin 1